MTKTKKRNKRNKQKHGKTKKHHSSIEIRKMIDTFQDIKQRPYIHVHIVQMNRDIQPVHNKRPYLEKIIQSLKHPHDDTINGLILENQMNDRFRPVYITGLNRVYKPGQFIRGGGRENSMVEIFFFPSYLPGPTEKDKYDNYLIVNRPYYSGFIDFFKKKLNSVENLFVYFKKERKDHHAKPTAFYKHVVNVLNEEEIKQNH